MKAWSTVRVSQIKLKLLNDEPFFSTSSAGICNSLGMRDVMSSLPSYSHQQAFNRLNYTPWLPLGEKAGAYKCIEDNSVSDMRSEALESRSETGGTLCYLEMDGAGHIVAKDKPKEAVQMISGWMKHRSLK